MSLKVWIDPVSQPSRTVWYVVKRLKLDHEFKLTKVVEDTRTEEFRKNVNPNGVVPVIEHDGEKIYESATIVRYLLDCFQGDETLLPRSDLKKRAKVDYWLDWNNTTARVQCGETLMELVIRPQFEGKPMPDEDKKKELMDKYNSCMKMIEDALDGHSYLTGDDLSIADIQLYNEITLNQMMLKLDYEDYPNIKAWVERIGSDEFVKECDEALHQRLEEMKPHE